jgi:hypothetical protein
MPIPELSIDGLLPIGVHDCTISELTERFGEFTQSDQRPRLCNRLSSYLDELKQAGIAKYLIVNGSFVTGIERPNDIDVLLILKDDVKLVGDVPPFEYNVRSKKYVRKHFGLDCFFGFEGDDTAIQILDLFQMVKFEPAKAKGVLRVAI